MLLSEDMQERAETIAGLAFRLSKAGVGQEVFMSAMKGTSALLIKLFDYSAEEVLAINKEAVVRATAMMEAELDDGE